MIKIDHSSSSSHIQNFVLKKGQSPFYVSYICHTVNMKNYKFSLLLKDIVDVRVTLSFQNE